MRIAIAGKKTETVNYVNYVRAIGAEAVVSLSLGDIVQCDGLILPGGGDITPAFFGEKNHGSQNICTEIDILQLQALDFCLHHRIPVLGICKGMQIINVGLGGSIIQDLPTAGQHCYADGDQYHTTLTSEGSLLHRLYGRSLFVNSAHHQAVGRLGSGLHAIQWHPDDGCVEALTHATLPVIGVQWHPERLDASKTTLSGEPLLAYFVSLFPSVRA